MRKPLTVRDLLTSDEVSAIRAASQSATRRHPTWYPIFHQEQRPVEHLTNQSVALVANTGDTEWLSALRPRLIRISDPEEAAAALAELRAYGAFLEAGFSVEPIPRASTATPDFKVSAGDDEVVVEVFAKHQDEDQKQLLDDLAAGKPPWSGTLCNRGRASESRNDHRGIAAWWCARSIKAT